MTQTSTEIIAEAAKTWEQAEADRALVSTDRAYLARIGVTPAMIAEAEARLATVTA